MKNILLGFLTIVLISSFGNAAINLDNGNYINSFGYPSDLTDAEAGSVGTITSRRGCAITLENYILFKFTRTDTTKTGLVVMEAMDEGSGENSWCYIGWGTDTASLVENNVTNMGGASAGFHVVKVSIPIGVGTYYVKIRNFYSGTAFVKYIKAFSDMNSYNAEAVHQLSCGTPFRDSCKEGKLTDALAYSSSLCNMATGTEPRGVYLASNVSLFDGVRYRFTGTAGQVQNAYITFTGLDYASGDGSWFWIEINDFTGNQLYINNLANLNGGPTTGGTYTINFEDISALAGHTEFEVHFYAGYLTTGYVALTNLEVGIGNPFAGDVNADCKVDFFDFAIIGEAWTGN